MKKTRKILGMLLVCFVVLSSGVFSGKVWAATVGDQLFNAESGWQRYDDNASGIEYSNGWEYRPDSQCFKGYFHFNQPSKGNDKASFKFIGSKLRIISPVNSSNNSQNIEINIDGISATYSTAIKESLYQVIVFEKLDLSFGIHTVVITNKAVGKYTNIDAIDIDSNGELIDPYTVKSISLNPSSLNLITSQTGTVVATVYPDTATNKNVTWSKDDSSIVSIAPNGLTCSVTGNTAGTTTLKASTPDGTVVGTCIITVTEPNHPVTGITLDKTSICLNRDQTEQATATITPENATNKNVSWSIDDSSIAEYTSNGLTCSVTGKNYGTTILRAKTEDGSIIATCTITVVPKTIGRSLLTIYLSNQTSRQYDVTTEELNAFLTWYDNRASGSGSVRYGFSKPVSSPAFSKRTEYIVFDKIVAFDVDDYSITEK